MLVLSVLYVPSFLDSGHQTQARRHLAPFRSFPGNQLTPKSKTLITKPQEKRYSPLCSTRQTLSNHLYPPRSSPLDPKPQSPIPNPESRNPRAAPVSQRESEREGGSFSPFLPPSLPPSLPLSLCNTGDERHLSHSRGVPSGVGFRDQGFSLATGFGIRDQGSGTPLSLALLDRRRVRRGGERVRAQPRPCAVRCLCGLRGL